MDTSRIHIVVARAALHICDSSLVGKAPPCQGGDRGFEPRLSLADRNPKHLVFMVVSDFFICPKFTILVCVCVCIASGCASGAPFVWHALLRISLRSTKESVFI